MASSDTVALWHALTRRKTPDTVEKESPLKRVLTLCDLLTLAVGSTLGLGVYVLAGSVAYNVAGPGVTLSFLLAALAAGFAGICYAEFAARVPKAGSAYVYSYVTIGEFVAFTIGWNLVCEYMIGTAGVARGMSGYFDTLVENRMSQALNSSAPIHVHYLGAYPDILSGVLIVVVSLLIGLGVRESSAMNIIFTSVNLVTICVALVSAGLHANPRNWFLPQDEIPPGFGKGGFLPYGIAGVFEGAARCFFGFVGFDCISTTGEEAINPRRNIPLAIVIAVFVVFFAYCGISTALTMMTPYYELDPTAPLLHAFESIGWNTIKWIVAIGACFALCTTLLGSLFPLPRILYAMGTDGVIFMGCASVNSYTRTPLWATAISGLLTSIIAVIFDLNQLIDMMSIGTLLAYSVVAMCVLRLRYDADERTMHIKTRESVSSVCMQLLNFKRITAPTRLSARIALAANSLFFVVSIAWCLCAGHFQLTTNDREQLSGEQQLVLGGLGFVLLLLIAVIARQPEGDSGDLLFKVPLLPYIPCFSVFVNLYLMFQLDWMTWVRFILWLGIGYSIYFGYGIRNSHQIYRDEVIRLSKLNEI